MGKRNYEDAVVEEEETAESNYYSVKRRRRRCSSSASQFFDEYAAVASDDDVEEDEYDGDDDFIDHASEFPKEDDRRIHRPRLLLREEDLEDIDEMERRLKERYMSRDHQVEYDDEITQVHQQALLPSVKDPKLWMVKCVIGHEREVAVSLMHKSIGKGPQVHIRSAIALDHLKNYIYIEAYKEAHVREVCKGMRNIYADKIMLVPIKEMTDVLTVETKAIDLARGSRVRRKTGKKKGDLVKPSSQGHFVKGDRIIVVQGDLKNLKGRVEKIEEDSVHIKPNEKGLPRTLVISKRQLSKYFEPGNHVKAVSGVSEGTTGMVVAVEGRVVIVVSDTTKETLRLFADTVVESSEVASLDPSLPMKLPRGGPTMHFGGMHRVERGHAAPIGAVVKICVGPYKGYKGRVVNLKGTMVRVELDSQMKVITVDRLSISDCVNVSACRETMGSETPMRHLRTPLRPILTNSLTHGCN